MGYMKLRKDKMGRTGRQTGIAGPLDRMPLFLAFSITDSSAFIVPGPPNCSWRMFWSVGMRVKWLRLGDSSPLPHQSDAPIGSVGS